MIKVLIILLCITSTVYANNGGTIHYTADQIHNKDFLGKVFPDKPKSRAEWNGQVDRHILSKADYENDSEVLISTPNVVKKYTEPDVIEKIVYVEREEEPAVIVRTQWCDEDDNCGEWND